MTVTLPPLFDVIGAVIGYIGLQIMPSTGAVIGGILGLLVWHVSDAPMTNYELLGDSK